MSTNHEARREARIAAAKAARAAAPQYGPEVRVPVSQVQAGDFLVVVPSQHGLQGTRYGSLVAEVVPVHAGQYVHGGTLRSAAAGIVFGTVHGGGGVRQGSQVWPSNFEAIVRRTA